MTTIPTWLIDYHDWLAWASRVDLWPLQARHPSPQQRAAEVVPPLSGATARAAIKRRYQPTIGGQQHGIH